MAKELRDVRVLVMMSLGEIDRLEDWQFSHRFGSRGDAIRRLIEVGMKVAKVPAKRRATKEVK